VSDTCAACFFCLSGIIQINEIAEEIKIMMSEIGIEIKCFTLVEDTI
jgi:hypothetical protein